jgi:hypothetical protein
MIASIQKSDLRKIAGTLDEIASSTRPGDPGNPFFNQKDAVFFLRKDIQRLMDRGWSLKAICGLLKLLNFEVRHGTILKYMDGNKYADTHFFGIIKKSVEEDDRLSGCLNNSDVFTYPQAIILLASRIRKLVNGGYTYYHVQEVLGKLGLKLPYSTLVLYTKRGVDPATLKVRKRSTKPVRTGLNQGVAI